MRLKITFLFSILMISGSAFIARTASAKATVSIFRLRDRSLIADFQDVTNDNCIITQTHIEFTESVTHIGGPPIIGPPTTLVSVVYANSCTGELISFMGGTTQQIFRIAPDLSTAALEATAPISDGAGNNANVSIDVQWVANAPAQQVKQKTVTRNANTLVVDRVNFQTRSANVSGSISTVLNVQNGPTALDLSRFPEDGQIGKNVEGKRTITFMHP
jgi:hypothetical protein